MNNLIVYVDDAVHAQPHLACPPGAGATHWLLVACAPRMTHRASKWASHSAREHWRDKWSDKLFAQIAPALLARGDQVTTVLARGPLPELTDKLLSQHGPARVLDARRPKLAEDTQAGPAPDTPPPQ